MSSPNTKVRKVLNEGDNIQFTFSLSPLKTLDATYQYTKGGITTVTTPQGEFDPNLQTLHFVKEYLYATKT